jgi:hypothetical protein
VISILRTIINLLEGHKERHMTDFTKLTADLAEIKALILAQQTPPSEQPAVDAAAAQAEEILNLLKPPAAATAPEPAPPVNAA